MLIFFRLLHVGIRVYVWHIPARALSVYVEILAGRVSYGRSFVCRGLRFSQAMVEMIPSRLRVPCSIDSAGNKRDRERNREREREREHLCVRYSNSR